jgi:UDP:flavonoid glycosyltransferase YjiC (YdhE family)
MRVMFCATAGFGHVQPMVPLTAACLRRGHRVAWATADLARSSLAGLDVELWPVGASAQACRAEYLARWPEARQLRGEALASHTFAKQFGAVAAPHMIDGLTRAVEAWRPDLVVREFAALAAPLVSARFGIPNVAHAYGLMGPLQRLKAAAHELARWWSVLGADVPDDAGLFRHLYIDIAPPSLQSPQEGWPVRVQRLQPNLPQAASLDRLPAPLAAALARAPDRPLVYLTFGTVFNRSARLRSAARALARLPATVVVTVGRDNEPLLLDRPADNVHVLRFITQNHLLPFADVVVSHAGSGTVFGALSHGLPQLLLPQAADQFRNAAACTAAGAALALPDVSADDEDAIEQTAVALLSSPQPAAAARRIGAEISAMPSPDDAAARLERL